MPELNWEEIKEHIDKLHQLSQDPQLGLWSWWAFFHNRLDKLNKASKHI